MMFKSLTKAIVGAAALPVSVVADVITLGGAMTDKPVPYTFKACSDIVKNVADATKPKGQKGE